MSGLIQLLKRYPVAILCAIISLAGIVVIFIRGGALDELQAEEEQLAARIDVIDRNAMNSSSIAEDLEDLDAAVAQIKERVFDREKRAINTNFFYAFGDAVEIEIDDVIQRRDLSQLFTKGGPRALSLHSTISYDIRVSGTYAQILALMYEFLVVDAIARISSFSLTPDNSVVEGGQPQFNLNMQVFVLSEKN